MISALTWATVSRIADRVEVRFAEQLSMTHEDVSTEISTQLLTLSELPFSEFMYEVSGDETAQITAAFPQLKKEQLGLAYAVHVGPYLVAQLLIHIVNMFAATVFFLLLFTRGSIKGFDTVRLFPRSLLGACGVLFTAITKPLFLLTAFGPFLALTVYLSGEKGIRASIKTAAERLWTLFLRVMIVCIGIVIFHFLVLWLLLIFSSAFVLVSFKIAFFLMLFALMLVIALFCAAFTILSAILA